MFCHFMQTVSDRDHLHAMAKPVFWKKKKKKKKIRKIFHNVSHWNSADGKLMILSYYSQKKKGFNISCKLSPSETICMKFRIQFSKKNVSKFRLLKCLASMLSVNWYICFCLVNTACGGGYHQTKAWQLLDFIKWTASSKNVPSNLPNVCRFRSSCPCAKYHLGLCTPFIYSVAANNSVGVQSKPWSGWFGPSVSAYAQRHIFAWHHQYVSNTVSKFHQYYLTNIPYLT